MSDGQTRKDHIEITDMTGANNFSFYRVLASNDLEDQRRRTLLDTHFFFPGELLQIAEYVAEHRAKLEAEAAAQPWRKPEGQ